VRLVTSHDYGILRLSFNGTPLGEPVDAYSSVIDAEFVALGTVEVNSEANMLTLEAAGRNPKSAGYRAGIDAVVLTPIR